MPLRRKLLLTVLGVIFVVLGIMLVIALRLGDDTTSDENNSDVNSNSAGLVSWHAGSAGSRSHVTAG